MKFEVGKKYVTDKGDIVKCREICADKSMLFDTDQGMRAFNKDGQGSFSIKYAKIVSEYMEPQTKEFDHTKPAQTKSGKKVFGLIIIYPPAKYSLVGYIQGENTPSWWTPQGESPVSPYFNLENIPEKKMVPLEAKDFKFGDLIRPIGSKNAWFAVLGVNGSTVLTQPSNYTFAYLQLNYEISRDRGETWEKCEKEVIV